MITAFKSPALYDTMPEARSDLDDSTHEAFQREFEKVKKDRFGERLMLDPPSLSVLFDNAQSTRNTPLLCAFADGPAAPFWVKLLRAYVATANGDGKLNKAEFKNMLSLIFQQVGQMHGATGVSAEAFFSLAGSNENDKVTFPELVAVFEIETMRSKCVSTQLPDRQSNLHWIGILSAVELD
jgi:hypothetical protein